VYTSTFFGIIGIIKTKIKEVIGEIQLRFKNLSSFYKKKAKHYLINLIFYLIRSPPPPCTFKGGRGGAL
jgi:hypothetical protein